MIRSRIPNLIPEPLERVYLHLLLAIAKVAEKGSGKTGVFRGIFGIETTGVTEGTSDLITASHDGQYISTSSAFVAQRHS